jgi:hypothetical protein
MIGVSVAANERSAAEEFFELFKTPWEFLQPDKSYEVAIVTSAAALPVRAKLCLAFGFDFEAYDATNAITAQPEPVGTAVSHRNRSFPLYGRCDSFPASNLSLVRAGSSRPIVYGVRKHDQTIVRVGYNLFAQVAHLLTDGQPLEQASVPTLDCHLELLRELITRAGVLLVEIPAVPAGHRFMVCLTHDIDHPILRNHRFDQTMFGYIWRAAIGTPLKLLAGRSSAKRVAQNWGAVARLPLVHSGLAADDWQQFDRYLQIESGCGATYFFIPKGATAGRRKNGSAPAKRACRYQLEELAPTIARIRSSGNEVGVHGIDAWLDSESGASEKARIYNGHAIGEVGVRMHWLYFDADSHAKLEAAGFTYDSTVGYNETVGYRAGTLQAYRPLGRRNLMELPLHIMDTALFYPDYLNLSEPEAMRRVQRMMEEATTNGGALTINWHDRSIFPERLWGEFYVALLAQVKQRQAWFPTAGQCVRWFRKRRAASLGVVGFENNRVTLRNQGATPDELPGLIVRFHRPCPRRDDAVLSPDERQSVIDVDFAPSMEVQLSA